MYPVTSSESKSLFLLQLMTHMLLRNGIRDQNEDDYDDWYFINPFGDIVM